MDLGKANTKSAVWSKTNGICFYCGTGVEPFENFTVDHFIPRSRGGSDELSNLVPACRSCNCSKHDLLLEEWRNRTIAKFTGTVLATSIDDHRYWFELKGWALA